MQAKQVRGESPWKARMLCRSGAPKGRHESLAEPRPEIRSVDLKPRRGSMLGPVPALARCQCHTSGGIVRQCHPAGAPKGRHESLAEPLPEIQSIGPKPGRGSFAATTGDDEGEFGNVDMHETGGLQRGGGNCPFEKLRIFVPPFP